MKVIYLYLNKGFDFDITYTTEHWPNWKWELFNSKQNY